MQSKFTSIIVGIVIIVLGVIAVVLYKPALPPASESPTPSATAQSVYEDEVIKFSYPTAWGTASRQQFDSEPNEVFPEARGKAFLITFSNNPNVRASMLSSDYAAYGNTAYRGNLNLKDECPNPNIVEQSDLIGATGGVGYCKLFQAADGGYMHYSLGFSPLPEGDGSAYLTQRAILNLNHPIYKGLELMQIFPDVKQSDSGDTTSYLMAIQLGSAHDDLLQKTKMFEEMMLSLEVK